MRKARTLITIDAPAKHENGVSVFVPTYIMQVTCSGTKDVLWVGVEKDQAKQGQWSQTELPSDGKKKKKTLGLFASNSSQMVTVLRATHLQCAKT